MSAPNTGSSDSQSPELGNSSSLNGPKATQACASCRKQKRKCDKQLPSCSLCQRMGRSCDYTEPPPNPTADDLQALRARLIDLEARLLQSNGNAAQMAASNPTPPQQGLITHNGDFSTPSVTSSSSSWPAFQHVRNKFPALAVLDGETFEAGGVQIPTPEVDVPDEVLAMIGDGQHVQETLATYFDTVHKWFPIISRKRMSRNLLNPLWEAGPDLALLFLCMKLVTLSPLDTSDMQRTTVYAAAKRFLLTLEASGLISLTMLQAYVLLGLYEAGQGIYPAAYMTVGSMARYGILVGVHDPEYAPQLLRKVTTWTDNEERRRVWWAVIILDRVVNIGSSARSLACADPRDEASLPVSTSAWEEGQITAEPVHQISSDHNVPVCPYARLCQAANLLACVYHHYQYRNAPREGHFEYVLELGGIITNFASILWKEALGSGDYLSLALALSITLSALTTLYDPYVCAGIRNPYVKPGEINKTRQAVINIKQASDSIQELAKQLVAATPSDGDLSRVGPFVLDALYAGGTNFAWDFRESGNEGSQASLDAIRTCMRKLSGRWGLGHEYLRILEAQEFQYAVGLV